MGNSSKALQLILATGLATTLAGCGGSDSPSRTSDTTTTTTTTDSTGTTSTTNAASLVATNPAHSIVITYPHLNATQDDSEGVYRRKVSALVQDTEGHPVADGTVVYLSIMDTVIARGTIESPDDSLSGAVLTDNNPTDAAGTPVTFDTVSVIRNNAYRQIEPGDMIVAGIEAGLADEADKFRLVADTTIDNTTLPVATAYQNTYPSPAGITPSYGSGETNYIVGASLLGAQVAGEPQESTTTSSTALDGGAATSTSNSGTLTAGVATTVNGIAQFRISYPANVRTVNTDCQNSSLDTRVSPVGSARIILAARVNDSVTTVRDDFCFNVITNGTITPEIESIGNNGVFDINFGLQDGGDEIMVPFWTVGASVTVTPAVGSTITVEAGSADPSNPDAILPAGSMITEIDGSGTIRIIVLDGISGDKATVTLRALDTTADITITIP